MEAHNLLHILRNPHGFSDNIQRQARHEAADNKLEQSDGLIEKIFTLIKIYRKE